MGFYVRVPQPYRREPSRSDELMVAVRLQPTERGLAKQDESRQRRLRFKRRRALGAVGANQPSLRDGRDCGCLPRGLKPPGYRQAPLCGDDPTGLWKNSVLRAIPWLAKLGP